MSEFASDYQPTENEKTITSPEIGAIKLINRHSPVFANDYPEIVDDALVNMKNVDIAKKYGVAELYGVTEMIARGIVKDALKELLDPEVRAERARALIQQAGKESLEAANFTHDQLSEFGSRGGKEASRRLGPEGLSRRGKVGGKATYDKRAGIHGFTPEKLAAGGRKSHQDREDRWFNDKMIDDKDEGTYALSLLQDPDYVHEQGQYKGRPDKRKILKRINDLYGKNRTKGQLADFFHYYKDNDEK